MISPLFEWDEDKAAINIAKHGISFDEAATVFEDDLAAIFDDDSHSDDELREVIIGNSNMNRLLVVCFMERFDKIRIISARPTTRRERQRYEEHDHF